MELRGLEGRLLLRRAARKWWLEYFDDDAKGYALWNAWRKKSSASPVKPATNRIPRQRRA